MTVLDRIRLTGLLVKRNDLKYERNEIIALLAKALLEKAVSRNYVRGANS
jgi:hypothetical protein